MREREGSPEIYRGNEALQKYNEFEGKRESQLLRATEKLSEEIVENQVSDVIFVDSSARPAATALREYWKLKQGDQAMPGLYFVNPFGFKDKEDIFELYEDGAARGVQVRQLDILSPAAAREQGQIESEFEKRYQGLMEHKDKAVMLLDTCAHSGLTLKLIMRTLENLGFQKVIIALASEHMCDISPHVTLLREADCRPFGYDTSMLKHQGSTESLRRGGYEGQPESDLLERDRSQLLRENIRGIIRKHFGQ